MTIEVPMHLDTAKKVMDYMLGGKAFVTIISNKTNRHFSYKITVAKNNAMRHFVWVNTTEGYMYVGTLEHKGKKFYHGNKGIPVHWQAYKSFVWAWRHVHNMSLPKTIAVYHYNRCSRCGRRLITPKSIRAGIGPECARQAGVRR